MTDQEYILKAVELADGWRLNQFGQDLIMVPGMAIGHVVKAGDPHAIVVDALAAQLRRQVNVTGKYVVHIEPHMVIVCSISEKDGSHRKVIETVADDGDESMNTIKAVVDSKVLE